MKFTQIPADTFKRLQLNAGILVTSFTPASGVIGDIIGATTGGNTFEATPEFEDFGSDIDNCPSDTKELKRLKSWTAKLSGSFITLTASSVADLLAAADIDGADSTHIVPRNEVKTTDFKDIWWIGDYSDVNDSDNGGFVAVHLMNALSTGGFKVKADNKSKGSFDYEYLAHPSISSPDSVPFEVYVKAGVVPEATENAAETQNEG